MIFKKPIFVPVHKWIPLPPQPYCAITLYPFVFVRYSLAKTLKWFTWSWLKKLIRHETIHFYQVQRVGWLKFYITYLIYQYKYGYNKNPYEQQAHMMEKDETYLPPYLEYRVCEEHRKRMEQRSL